MLLYTNNVDFDPSLHHDIEKFCPYNHIGPSAIAATIPNGRRTFLIP